MTWKDKHEDLRVMKMLGFQKKLLRKSCETGLTSEINGRLMIILLNHTVQRNSGFY